MEPKYPDIELRLSGTDGNVFAVLSRAKHTLVNGLRDAGHSVTETADEAEAFMAEATSGDYEHALATCMRWMEVS